MKGPRSRQSLFDAVGGLPTLEKVHRIFYDKIYAHPWIGQFFKGHDQRAIELRQTQFMGEKFGGPVKYPGMELELAHRRMYITPELFSLRQKLLRESLEEAGVAPELVGRWLRIDAAFRKDIVNESLEDFETIDLKYERPLVIPNPADTQH
ncbi:MAG TPA: group 1 truncated hemoglobin [Mariprofundaceae bacterium]|nr:group 1 truncated hemoglobin [Mariprofundaceae bacterium]